MFKTLNNVVQDVGYVPHKNIYQTQWNNFRVVFNLTHVGEGNVKVQMESTESVLKNFVVDFELTINEFIKQYAQNDSAAKTLLYEMKKDKISKLRINGTLSITWKSWVSVHESMFLERNERAKKVIALNPNGPRVNFTGSGVMIMDSEGEMHHDVFPSNIMVYNCERNYATAYPVVAAPTIDASKYQYRIEYRKHGKFAMNSKSGAPSNCLMACQGMTIQKIMDALFTYNTNAHSSFFQGVGKKGKFISYQYWYDEKIIPDDMVQELRFPMDEAQEFDLLMRL